MSDNRNARQIQFLLIIGAVLLHRTIVPAILAFSSLLILFPDTAEAEPAGWKWENRFLDPEIPLRSNLMVENTEGASESYSVVVDDDDFGIILEISDAPADLDIALYDEAGNRIALSESEVYNEKVIITRISDPPLTSGRYNVKILYQLPFLPVYEGKQKQVIPYILNYHTIKNTPVRQISQGAVIEGKLLPIEGMLKTYLLDVPDNISVIRIDLFDTQGDLDILVNIGVPFVDPYNTDYRSESLLSRESLVIFPEEEYVEPGAYFLSIMDQVVPDVVQPFSLVVSFNESPPEFLQKLPDIPNPAEPLEKALLSTVEIFSKTGGGSGCIIHPSGYILTSWHVVRGPSGKAEKGLVIGMSLDNELPAKELFVGEVIARDPERDFALLKITSGLYGQSLDDDFVFPFFKLGEPEELHVGDPLGFIGYPDIGGTGSRVSITYTRGIVSGFQRSDGVRIIKTDAQINKGNSGGAAVNHEFQLIGIPSQIVGNGSAKLGYISPVSQIPADWLPLIRPVPENSKR